MVLPLTCQPSTRSTMTDLVFRSANRRYGLQIDAGRVESILRLCRDARGQETGGILIGRYSARLDCALVVNTTPAPQDSRSGPTWFERGVTGLQQLLDRSWRSHREHYLGEWHFHPFAPPTPSPDDIQQMLAIARNRSWKCPEPVLLIIGGDPDSHWQAYAFVTSRTNGRIELQAVQS